MAGLSYGQPKPVPPRNGGSTNFWDQLKSFAQQQVNNASTWWNNETVGKSQPTKLGMQLQNAHSAAQQEAQMNANLWRQTGPPTMPGNPNNPYNKPITPLATNNGMGPVRPPAITPYNPYAPATWNRPTNAYNPNATPSYMLPTTWAKPTLTNTPDTYLQGAARGYDQRNLRMMPDNYFGMKDSLNQQLTGYQQPTTTRGGASGSGSGYGYGGWGGGGGGGGGYEPASPQWWMQLVNWNINRPQGG